MDSWLHAAGCWVVCTSWVQHSGVMKGMRRGEKGVWVVTVKRWKQTQLQKRINKGLIQVHKNIIISVAVFNSSLEYSCVMPPLLHHSFFPSWVCSHRSDLVNKDQQTQSSRMLMSHVGHHSEHKQAEPSCKHRHVWYYKAPRRVYVTLPVHYFSLNMR